MSSPNSDAGKKETGTRATSSISCLGSKAGLVCLQLSARRLIYDEAYSTTQFGKAEAFPYNKKST